MQANQVKDLERCCALSSEQHSIQACGCVCRRMVSLLCVTLNQITPTCTHAMQLMTNGDRGCDVVFAVRTGYRMANGSKAKA